MTDGNVTSRSWQRDISDKNSLPVVSGANPRLNREHELVAQFIYF